MGVFEFITITEWVPGWTDIPRRFHSMNPVYHFLFANTAAAAPAPPLPPPLALPYLSSRCLNMDTTTLPIGCLPVWVLLHLQDGRQPDPVALRFLPRAQLGSQRYGVSRPVRVPAHPV
jgi:hypothetical protein